MSIHLAKVDFTRGEINPLLHARIDVDPYHAGLKTCVNWLPLQEGGLRKRSGTSFIAEVKDSGKKTRLIPFIFSSNQAYVLELGDNMFRVCNSFGQVVDGGGAPVEIATPWPENEIAALDFAQSADRLYVTHGDVPPREISRYEDDVWSLDPHQHEDGPYLPGNKTGTSLTVSDRGDIVPFMTSNTAPSGTVDTGGGGTWQVFDNDEATAWTFSNPTPDWIAYALPAGEEKICTGYSIRAGKSNADFMPSAWRFEGWDGSQYVPIDSRTAETGWVLDEIRHFSFPNDVAFSKFRLYITQLNGQDGSSSAYMATLRLKESGDAMTPVTITASAVTGINGDAGFKATDVGRHIRMRGSDGDWRWARITAHIDALNVSARLYGPVFMDTDPMLRWQLGAWSEETGWPAHVGFYRDRLVFARTDTQPQAIWGSKVSDYADHGVSSPLVDDDAIDLEILSGEINAINWLVEGRELMLGTTAATRTISPMDATKPLSASNVQQNRQSTFGAAEVRPVQVGKALIYAGPYGHTLREFLYSLDVDGFITPELTILSSHLLKSGVKELAYAQEPDAVIWIVCNDGSLVSLTYERDQKVVALARHQLGGVDAVVESLAVIPGVSHHEVWLCVSRTIGGATRKYIERLNPPFEDSEVEDGIFLDSAISYSGAPVSGLYGLGHLEGETVTALADGMVHAGLTVSGGQIFLPDGVSAARIHVGLAYESRAVTLPPSEGSRGGAVLGRSMRAVRVIADVYRSLGLMVGGASRQEAFLQRRAGEPTDQAAPPRTGPHSVSVSHSREEEGEITLLSALPLPALIRGLNIQYEIEP